MNQDRSTQILFGLVFIGVPSLYFSWCVIPYLLFYAFPFVALSLIIAGIWFAAVMLTEDDYSWLGIIIPLTALLVFFLVGFPKEHLLLKNGDITIDGVFFYHGFNSVKTWFDYSLWSVIPQGLSFLAPTVPVPKELYDLNSVRWIFWVSLGIGAPVVFRFLASHKVTAIKAALDAKYETIAKDNEDELDLVRTKKLQALRHAENEKRVVEQNRDHYRDEHAKLKALLEFQKKAHGATNEDGERENKKGVLDSEDL